jgi:glycosyltransferase involved in cell wall biosynthesis
MKIAQIAPLAESVPPRRYGDTERVMSYLTEELVRLGHDVKLFASADAREFDVLHFHLEHLHLPAFRPWEGRCVTTLHGRLDPPDRVSPNRELDDMPLVSVSNAQRRPLPQANWVGTVYHGLPDAVCPYNPAPRGHYLAFLGQVSPGNGLERAVEIARRSGWRLRVAAKADSADQGYWRARNAPLLSDPLVDFIGEVTEAQKPALLGNAAALLSLIDRPEPFGLAMIEAMSCGTPVIAWPHGSVPEVVEDGITGFVVDSVDDALAAVRDISGLDRAEVRSRFEERFSAARMARDYLSVYRTLGRKHDVSTA